MLAPVHQIPLKIAWMCWTRLACPIFSTKVIEVYCNQVGCASGIGEVPLQTSAYGRIQPFEKLTGYYN